MYILEQKPNNTYTMPPPLPHPQQQKKTQTLNTHSCKANHCKGRAQKPKTQTINNQKHRQQLIKQTSQKHKHIKLNILKTKQIIIRTYNDIYTYMYDIDKTDTHNNKQHTMMLNKKKT